MEHLKKQNKNTTSRTAPRLGRLKSIKNIRQMYYRFVLQIWIQFRKDPRTERTDEKSLAPKEMRVSLWCVKILWQQGEKMLYSSSSISKIAAFMKMPQDASTKIKILMKIHKTATLNSPSERSHKIGLILGPAIRLSRE